MKYSQAQANRAENWSATSCEEGVCMCVFVWGGVYIRWKMPLEYRIEKRYARCQQNERAGAICNYFSLVCDATRCLEPLLTAQSKHESETDRNRNKWTNSRVNKIKKSSSPLLLLLPLLIYQNTTLILLLLLSLLLLYHYYHLTTTHGLRCSQYDLIEKKNKQTNLKIMQYKTESRLSGP